MSNSTAKPIGIIGAMPQELSLINESITNLVKINYSCFEFITGDLNGTPVVIMQSGIGKVNATIATTLMINHFQPSVIINTGSAGGIYNKLSIGDIVIADTVIHHDVDLTVFGYKYGQMAQMPENYSCDENLVKASYEVINQGMDSKAFIGQIASGDQFIGNKEKLININNTFPDVFAVEMEASAIGQTCYRLKTPFVIVRSISDLANNEANVSFDEFIEYAGIQSAKFVINLIDKVKNTI